MYPQPPQQGVGVHARTISPLISFISPSDTFFFCFFKNRLGIQRKLFYERNSKLPITIVLSPILPIPLFLYNLYNLLKSGEISLIMYIVIDSRVIIYVILGYVDISIKIWNYIKSNLDQNPMLNHPSNWEHKCSLKFWINI